MLSLSLAGTVVTLVTATGHLERAQGSIADVFQRRRPGRADRYRMNVELCRAVALRVASSHQLRRREREICKARSSLMLLSDLEQEMERRIEAVL